VYSNWSDGYITEIEYTANFYRELAPTHFAFAALLGLVEAPPTDRPFTYFELGCGHGVATNLLAACHPDATFYGNDINPSHILSGRQLAAEAGLSNVHFLEKSFAELADVTLPPLDFISMHGIYALISDDNRRFIVDFIRRRLRPGGLVYVSYNAMPGWSVPAALQRLVAETAERATGTVGQRIEHSLGILERMLTGQARFFAVNPVLKPWLDGMKGQDRTYLAHEYLCGNWHAFYAADVMREMGEAKLSLVGSVLPIEMFDDMTVPPDLRELVRGITDRALRETVRDFAINAQLRRDIYARGLARIDPAVQRERLLTLRLALNRTRELCTNEFNLAFGATLNVEPEITTPVYDALAAQPRSTLNLLADPALAKIGAERLLRTMITLIATGAVQVCASPEGDAARRRTTEAFNRVVIERAQSARPPRYLASPIAANGVPLDPIDGLFLDACRKGRDPIGHTEERFLAMGRQLMKEGKPIADAEEARRELEARYRTFYERLLPAWQAIGIATDLVRAETNPVRAAG